jgi:methionine-S-sulfoxide reductase
MFSRILFLIAIASIASQHSFAQKPESATLILAGGCFWCMEPPFEKLNGVREVISGYAGGDKETATYDQVSSGKTKHLEVVQVIYDPKVVSLRELMTVYWREIDPLDGEGQFCDRGQQYTTAVFYNSEAEKKIIEQSKSEVLKLDKFKGANFATAIRPSEPFYPAEKYHQDYYKENPIKYKFYRASCGRDSRLKQLWGRAK